jgi:3-oxoacyl-[acyl-carrier protein] reductase
MRPSGAIVTGAAGAIGRAIAMRLAQDGCAVVCVDRDERVTRVVQEINAAGGTGASCMVDLTDDHASWEVLAHSGLIGPISLLVNNAGVTSDARALEMSDDAFRNVVRINAVAPLRLADAVAPHLAEGGSVVNIASRAALGNFGQANYVTAKAALVGATRAMALRWAPRLRVNAVAPGLVDTPMTQAMPRDVLEKLIGRVPARRAASPDEVAKVVAFLASDGASYITGQTLLACGGRSVAG